MNDLHVDMTLIHDGLNSKVKDRSNEHERKY